VVKTGTMVRYKKKSAPFRQKFLSIKMNHKPSAGTNKPVAEIQKPSGKCGRFLVVLFHAEKKRSNKKKNPAQKLEDNPDQNWKHKNHYGNQNDIKRCKMV